MTEYVECPRCGFPAEIYEENATVGLSTNRHTETVYVCKNGCEDSCYGLPATDKFEPDPDAGGHLGVSYKPLTFTADGTVVI